MLPFQVARSLLGNFESIILEATHERIPSNSKGSMRQFQPTAASGTLLKSQQLCPFHRFSCCAALSNSILISQWVCIQPLSAKDGTALALEKSLNQLCHI